MKLVTWLAGHLPWNQGVGALFVDIYILYTVYWEISRAVGSIGTSATYTVYNLFIAHNKYATIAHGNCVLVHMHISLVLLVLLSTSEYPRGT